MAKGPKNRAVNVQKKRSEPKLAPDANEVTKTGDKPSRAKRLLRKGETWVMIACLALGLVSAATSGVFDDPIQKDIRVSNVYVAPGVDVDEAKAEGIVGNRALVIVYLRGKLGDRGRDVCESLKGIAKGSFVGIVDDDLRMYGCSLLPGADDENFGKAYVAESLMRSGISWVADDKIQSARTMASTYDRLVSAGVAPQEAREIRAPFAHYLVAIIALATALIGSLAIYLRGRRLGHAFADAAVSDAELRGKAQRRDAALASLGVRLLEADETIQGILAKPITQRTAGEQRRLKTFTRLTAAYNDLNDRARDTEADAADLDDQLSNISRARDRFDAI